MIHNLFSVPIYIEKLNLNNILRVEKTFPQIRMKIYNFVEFHKKG